MATGTLSQCFYYVFFLCKGWHLKVHTDTYMHLIFSLSYIKQLFACRNWQLELKMRMETILPLTRQTTSAAARSHAELFISQKPVWKVLRICLFVWFLLGEAPENALNKLKCPHCNYIAKHRRTLKRHLIIHSGVRSFSCDICGKLFTRREHVKRHSLVRQKHQVLCVGKSHKHFTLTSKKSKSSP